MRRRTLIFIVLVALLAPAGARADGFDVFAYVTRLGFGGSPVVALLMLLGLMVANYVLNFLVIGLPALRMGGPSLSIVLRGLIPLTLLGQVADRLGAVLAVPLTFLVTQVMARAGRGEWVLPLFACNFVMSGLAVALLARYFLARRWGIHHRLVWPVALVAGLVSNPAWALALWLK